MADFSKIPNPIKKLAGATLSKVANKFVDFIITKYTGKSIKVFEAEGDIEADKVKTKWEFLEKPLWLQAEAIKMNRQYSNLGKVLMKSTPLIEAESSKVTDDNDIFWGFLEHSKEISNEEMQELIAKIIAGEYNNPGSYSMATLQVVKMLGKNEIELFEKISSLLINDEQIPSILFSGQDKVKDIMKKFGIDFAAFQMLQNVGLFLSNSMKSNLPNPEKKNLEILYFDKILTFTPENDNAVEVKIPSFYGLSPVGKQILPHLNPKYIKEYYLWLKDNYKINYYSLSLTP